MRARGFLGEFESNLGDLHRYRIRWERKRGVSLRAARLHADDLITRVKDLIAGSPVSRRNVVSAAGHAEPGKVGKLQSDGERLRLDAQGHSHERRVNRQQHFGDEE